MGNLIGWKAACVILLLAFTILKIDADGNANGHRQKFGENCSRNKKCDFTKWLKCDGNGKCICFQNNLEGKMELYYDHVAERCVGRSGTNCSQKFYPFDDEDLHHFTIRGSTTNHWRYGNGSLRCGANAFCDFDGVNHFCNCRASYYETEIDGKCAKLKRYSDSCTTDRECDPDGYLKCENGACQCERDDHKYDAYKDKCVVTSGLPCEIRHNRLDGRQLDDCTPGAFCEEESRVCRCDRGTQIHSNRTCQRGFGHECDLNDVCGDSKLSCRSKVCQCKYPLHMKYDEESGQCVAVASGPCVFNDTSELAIQCTENAECVKRGLFSECKCQAGFIQTVEGDCVKVFGSECEMDSDCDRVGPLACINGHCECQDLFLRYDTRTRKCKGLLGSRCKLDEDSCIDHATCNKYEDVAGGKIGKCLCNRGYRENENRTCSN